MNYRVLHGIGGNNIGVVIGDIGVKAIGNEADADIPFDHKVITSMVSSPNSGDPNSSLAVSLVKLESVQVIISHCEKE